MHRSIKALVCLAHVAVPFVGRGFANLPDDALRLIKTWNVSLNIIMLDIGGTAENFPYQFADLSLWSVFTYAVTYCYFVLQYYDHRNPVAVRCTLLIVVLVMVAGFFSSFYYFHQWKFCTLHSACTCVRFILFYTTGGQRCLQ